MRKLVAVGVLLASTAAIPAHAEFGDLADFQQQVNDLADRVRNGEAAAAVVAVVATGAGIAVTYYTGGNWRLGALAAGAVILLALPSLVQADQLAVREVREIPLDYLPVNFAGIGVGPGGVVSYSGVRSGASVSGTYDTGQFGGVVTTTLRVRGNWQDVTGYYGAFHGVVTPDLSQAFGNAVCYGGPTDC